MITALPNLALSGAAWGRAGGRVFVCCREAFAAGSSDDGRAPSAQQSSPRESVRLRVGSSGQDFGLVSVPSWAFLLPVGV